MSTHSIYVSTQFMKTKFIYSIYVYNKHKDASIASNGKYEKKMLETDEIKLF